MHPRVEIFYEGELVGIYPVSYQGPNPTEEDFFKLALHAAKRFGDVDRKDRSKLTYRLIEPEPMMQLGPGFRRGDGPHLFRFPLPDSSCIPQTD